MKYTSLTRDQSDGLLPRQPVPIGSDGVRLSTFPPPPQELYFALYLLSLSQLTLDESDIELVQRRTVFIGSDGVRLPTYLPLHPQLYALLYIH